MRDGMEIVLLLEDLLTVISSAINTLYFASYRTSIRGRRIGAKALLIVSGATFIEALYHGISIAMYGMEVSLTSISPGLSIMVRALIAIGSIAVSLLVLRQRWTSKTKSL